MTTGILERLSGDVVLGDGGRLLEPGLRGYVRAEPFVVPEVDLTRSRAAMGGFALQARETGFDYIGSCCGSVAAHVREMAKALGKLSGRERGWLTTTGTARSGYGLPRMGDG